MFETQHHTITVGDFSGPLDLLLSLIQEEKMEISDISLSAVTGQFLHYVQTLEEEKADEIADFLVVAAKLLLLKSKELLPQFLGEEEDETDIAAQLRRYRLFVGVSREVAHAWQGVQKSFFREEPLRKPNGFVPPENVTPKELWHRMRRLITRLAPVKPLPTTRIDRTVSLKEKIRQIQELLKKKRRYAFHEFLAEKENRTELIVGFLAMLELVKAREVHLEQSNSFDTIYIHAT